jgi:hypothetical protein
MPLEAATYITDLVPTNPVHTDPLSAADSQMRLIKQVLKNTFPNASTRPDHSLDRRPERLRPHRGDHHLGRVCRQHPGQLPAVQRP